MKLKHGANRHPDRSAHDAATSAAVVKALEIGHGDNVCQNCFLTSLVASAVMNLRMGDAMDEAEVASFLTAVCMEVEAVHAAVTSGKAPEGLEIEILVGRH